MLSTGQVPHHVLRGLVGGVLLLVRDEVLDKKKTALSGKEISQGNFTTRGGIAQMIVCDNCPSKRHCTDKEACLESVTYCPECNAPLLTMWDGRPCKPNCSECGYSE